MAQALTEPKLREWMQKLGPRLISISAAICRDHHHAQEIVQEAFVKLWRNPPDAGEVAYASWLRRVTTNLSINALKRTRRPAALPHEVAEGGRPGHCGPEARFEREESLQRVREAMDRLDEPKRAILVLRAYEQLSYDDIAEHLGIPGGTVMSRLNRARRALMEELRSNLEHEDSEPLVFDIRDYRTG